MSEWCVGVWVRQWTDWTLGTNDTSFSRPVIGQKSPILASDWLKTRNWAGDEWRHYGAQFSSRGVRLSDHFFSFVQSEHWSMVLLETMRPGASIDAHSALSKTRIATNTLILINESKFNYDMLVSHQGSDTMTKWPRGSQITFVWETNANWTLKTKPS